jgi:hypothetical protein
MSNRYTIKTLNLNQLRELRGELRRDAEASARKRKMVEQARTRDNAWTELKGTTRPLRIK